MTTTIPIANARYYPNQKNGKATGSKTAQSVYYYAFGLQQENPEQLIRGQWYRPDSEAEQHGHVVNWAQGKAVTHKYTYTLVLSLKDGLMQDQDFVKAMQATSDIFPDWRLIPHYDTDHNHAHIVTFRDTVLSKKELRQWRETTQEILSVAEQQRIEEQQQNQSQLEMEETGRDTPPLELDWDEL